MLQWTDYPLFLCKYPPQNELYYGIGEKSEWERCRINKPLSSLLVCRLIMSLVESVASRPNIHFRTISQPQTLSADINICTTWSRDYLDNHLTWCNGSYNNFFNNCLISPALIGFFFIINKNTDRKLHASFQVQLSFICQNVTFSTSEILHTFLSSQSKSENS